MALVKDLQVIRQIILRKSCKNVEIGFEVITNKGEDEIVKRTC